MSRKQWKFIQWYKNNSKICDTKINCERCYSVINIIPQSQRKYCDECRKIVTKELRRKASKKYNAKNKEAIKIKRIERKEKNPEKYKEQTKKYNEQQKDNKRKWDEENKDKMKLYRKTYNLKRKKQ